MGFHVHGRDVGEERVCLTYQALQRWVRRQLGAVDHERRVTAIGSKLFDLTWPLHGLRVGSAWHPQGGERDPRDQCATAVTLGPHVQHARAQ